ncbi:hypothetical protein IDJ75_01810 [Mucilaginibacter rigui]|uniref:Lipocalin-like domain-containing protein n=1 Tax=Mucilaginibacter rigui TaxID=534635 RepID=A0ABR7X080_9SPHI|nr:hypothetical protein [Mucilaginibacter rigui]MBD1383996.1 hypothetical protein [Mucilaginibacter rigui]
MRKIYLLLLIATIGLSSCKKEAKTTPKTFDISGNWKLTSLSTDFINGVQIVATLSNQSTGGYVDHMIFNSDGTGSMTLEGKTIREFKYDVTDSKIHFSSVFYHNGHTLVSERSFMSLITNFAGSELEFTDQIYVYTKENYNGKPYDRFERHISLVKEK